MKNVVLKKVRVRLIIIILVIIFSVIGFLKIKSDKTKEKLKKIVFSASLL